MKTYHGWKTDLRVALGGLALALLALWCAGCSDPTNPCETADYVMETAVYNANGDSIVAVAQICVTGPIVVK